MICVLGDWDNVDTCEGIFFTTKAIYVNSPKNDEKRFRVRYDDIKELDLLKLTNKLNIKDYENKTHRITTPLWNAYTIKLFSTNLLLLLYCKVKVAIYDISSIG